jgi:hypothetical protein
LDGFKVARIDRSTGVVSDFITHPSNTLAVIFECTMSKPDGSDNCFESFNKPIDVRFRGPEMFIVDFGVFAPAPVTPNSGKIWKVTHFAKQ